MFLDMDLIYRRTLLAPDYALYLTALAVHPALRRRGVASSLLKRSTRTRLGEGLAQVILHVEDDNDAAIAFYEARDPGE